MPDTLVTPEELRRHAKTLLDTAEELERAKQPQDLYGEGEVIRFTKPGRYRRGEFGDDFLGRLTYAAIKAGDRERCWFLTGITQRAKTWDELLLFIGRQNFDTIQKLVPAVVEETKNVRAGDLFDQVFSRPSGHSPGFRPW